jgi:hypothetical protein
MRLFISKYELGKLILVEYQFHYMDITLFTFQINCGNITKMYGSKLQYNLYINICYISFKHKYFPVWNGIIITDLLIYIVNLKTLS